MTDTIREQILVATVAVLSTISGVTVTRNRMVPASSVLSQPALIVRDGAQSSEIADSISKQHLLQFAVEGHLHAADGETLGSAVNALYGQIVSAILADITLGGLTQDITEAAFEPSFENEAGQKATGSFIVQFEVEFYTPHSDPYTVTT